MTLNQFLPPSPLIAKYFVGIYKNRIDLCVKEEEEVIFHIISNRIEFCVKGEEAVIFHTIYSLYYPNQPQSETILQPEI